MSATAVKYCWRKDHCQFYTVFICVCAFEDLRVPECERAHEQACVVFVIMSPMCVTHQ